MIAAHPNVPVSPNKNVLQNVPRVAVILVNWNGKADTLECLASLSAIEYSNVQIIVVDNGSHDDSATCIRNAFPAVELIETKANLGFTGGNNVGIKCALKSDANFIFLLNNDTTIEPQAINELVKSAQENPSFGLLTPVVNYYDRPAEAWFCGSRLDMKRGIAVHDNAHPLQRDEGIRETAWASGCTMFFPADVLRRLRGFDDRYFLNWEDVDLSLRVRRAGFKIGLVPSARVFHKVGRAFEQAQASGSATGLYYSFRNNLLLVRLHSGRWAWSATLCVLGRQLRERARMIAHKNPHAWKGLKVACRAARDHLLRRYGARPH